MNTHHTSSRCKKFGAGFTLVELSVVLAIVASILAFGIPSLNSLLTAARVNSASSSFLSHLYLARSEALKRRARVSLCKSADGDTCTQQGGWEQGWIIFSDPNGDGQRGADEVLIHRGQALASGLSFSGNATLARFVSFSASGSTQQPSGAFQAGTFTICRASNAATPARQIVINAAGRPRVERTTVAACA